MSLSAGALLQLAFGEMLAELESNELRVELVPLMRETNIGGCRRVAVSKNCTWYQRYCANHLSDRKRKNRAIDTKIKRRSTIATLEALHAGLPRRSKYNVELTQLAMERALKLAAAFAA